MIVGRVYGLVHVKIEMGGKGKKRNFNFTMKSTIPYAREHSKKTKITKEEENQKAKDFQGTLDER